MFFKICMRFNDGDSNRKNVWRILHAVSRYLRRFQWTMRFVCEKAPKLTAATDRLHHCAKEKEKRRMQSSASTRA